MNDQSNEVKVYKVPSDNLGVLRAKFEKLGRRAKKLGLPPPSFTDIGTERVEKKYRDDEGNLVEKVYLLHHITVDPGTSEVKVNGWTFIASVSHTEEGNILRKIGEVEIPVQYRTVSQFCEHCRTQRNRKDTYLLFNEVSETYKQVGRNCLQDFFGCSALIYAERAQYLVDISSLGEAMEDDMGFGGGGGPRYDALEKYLAHVAECIKHEGWMSRSRARALSDNERSLVATSDVAWSHLHPSPLFKPMYRFPSDESVKIANDAIEWASELDADDDSLSDYLHNIRVIARRGVVECRDYGLAASIVSAYQRHLNVLRQQEIRARRSEIAKYVGNVGDRLVFKLYVEKVLPFDRQAFSYYDSAITYLHIFGDTEGNCFTWWSSNKLDEGKDVVLKGTIKKQEEYKGVKQNQLTRCTEVEIKTFIAIVDGIKYSVQGLNELEVRKELRSVLGVNKLPRGLQIVEDVPEQATGLEGKETFTVSV